MRRRRRFSWAPSAQFVRVLTEHTSTRLDARPLEPFWIHSACLSNLQNRNSADPQTFELRHASSMAWNSELQNSFSLFNFQALTADRHRPLERPLELESLTMLDMLKCSTSDALPLARLDVPNHSNCFKLSKERSLRLLKRENLQETIAAG